jgi:DNA invertase Pin-like site-specific DNA recombinase
MQHTKSDAVKAAIYARSALVGSPSISKQTTACKQFAAQQNLEVDPARVYIDHGVLKDTLNVRPALLALLDAANSRPRPFGVVIIESSSRLARDTAIVTVLTEKLVAAGVEVIDVSDNLGSREACRP